MATVRIEVDSEVLGTVEATQISVSSIYSDKFELDEIKTLVQKATDNIYGAYGIEAD